MCESARVSDVFVFVFVFVFVCLRVCVCVTVVLWTASLIVVVDVSCKMAYPLACVRRARLAKCWPT
jgi:hypothetical protein